MTARPMKALSMNEPWASLFLTPEKQWETRSRRILFRGWLAIHASKSLSRQNRLLCGCHPFRRALRQSVGIEDTKQFALGCVIGVVRIIGCVEAPTVLDGRAAILPQGIDEASFGNFAPGRFAWQRAGKTYRLPKPVPCTGALGLWDLPRVVETAVVEQLRCQSGDGTWPPVG